MPSWGNRKPPFGTPIDGSHPLAQGLVFYFPYNEGAGNAAYDLVRPRGSGPPFIRYPDANPWRWPGYLLPTTSDLAWAGNIPAVWKLQPPLSIVWQGSATVANAANPNTSIFQITYSDPVVSPTDAVGFGCDAARGVILAYNRAGTRVTKTFGVTHDGDLAKHQYVGVFDQRLIDGTNYALGYRDGVSRVGDNVAIPSITYTATSSIALGTCGNLNTEMAALYNRVLSVAHQNWLRAEPFAMFRYPAQAQRASFLSSAVANGGGNGTGGGGGIGPVLAWTERQKRRRSRRNRGIGI